MPDVGKTYQFCLCYISVKHRIALIQHTTATTLIQHTTAGQFDVSACSQQALCYYAKNTDEQLGNVKHCTKVIVHTVNDLTNHY